MPPARTSKDNAEFSADLQNRGKADHEADDDKKFGDGAAQFVYRVCLTGGPCVGKSSSQDALSKALVAAGYNDRVLRAGGANDPDERRLRLPRAGGKGCADHLRERYYSDAAADEVFLCWHRGF
jgi:hypothetical protein